MKVRNRPVLNRFILHPLDALQNGRKKLGSLQSTLWIFIFGVRESKNLFSSIYFGCTEDNTCTQLDHPECDASNMINNLGEIVPVLLTTGDAHLLAKRGRYYFTKTHILRKFFINCQKMLSLRELKSERCQIQTHSC